MSPSSRCASYGPVGACKTERDSGFSSAMVSGGDGQDGCSPIGIRKPETSGAVLRVSRESHRIRKPPLPLPQVQYRPPIIIHTYSPKVLHAEPDDFMSLVQKLTGSSDTRLRLKKTKPSPSKKDHKSSTRGCAHKDSNPESPAPIGGARIGTTPGSASPAATSNCRSPSSSEDSATFVVTESPGTRAGEVATMKQSTSPRSPFDCDFEFDNNNNNDDTLSMFSQTVGTMMFSQNVKPEPLFSFTETHNNNNNNSSPFTFFTDFMHPKTNHKLPPQSPKLAQSRPQVLHPLVHPYIDSDIDMNSSHLPYLSPNLLPGLSDLSPVWSGQSNFPDCLSVPNHFLTQAPYLHQRQQFSGGYNSPSPEGTIVTLENIHAFTLT